MGNHQNHAFEYGDMGCPDLLDLNSSSSFCFFNLQNMEDPIDGLVNHHCKLTTFVSLFLSRVSSDKHVVLAVTRCSSSYLVFGHQIHECPRSAACAPCKTRPFFLCIFLVGMALPGRIARPYI